MISPISITLFYSIQIFFHFLKRKLYMFAGLFLSLRIIVLHLLSSDSMPDWCEECHVSCGSQNVRVESDFGDPLIHPMAQCRIILLYQSTRLSFKTSTRNYNFLCHSIPLLNSSLCHKICPDVQRNSTLLLLKLLLSCLL